MKKTRSARTIASKVLNRFDKGDGYAVDILSKEAKTTEQRRPATEMVLGTLRNRSAIDLVIVTLGDCPIERISAKVLNIIRIGVYELIYCPQIPEYAIVNEAVENAKAISGKKQTGFVNAILRETTRHLKDRQSDLAQANPLTTLPQNPLTGCQFDIDILPDCKQHPADHLSKAFSLPEWLIQNWLNHFSFEETRQICFGSNRKPSVYLNPNPLKIATEQLAEKLRSYDVEYESVPDESMIKLKNPGPVTDLPGFADGLFSIQDLTAAKPVKILNPQPNWKILDLCAAPGTKTIQLAQLTNDNAEIFATDIDSERLKKVTENINRLNLKSISIINYADLEKCGKFDCVLIDAPCSNTGVLAKRPEVRYRIKEKTIAQLTKTQHALLETAANLLKPSGTICYSTCSIEHNENGEMIKQFLSENKSFELKSEHLALPSAKDFDHDGGYTAVISNCNTNSL
jgi:16S rRNA (cytosine967-C5)-methyltransferase